MKDRLRVGAGILPGRNVREMFVIPQRFTVGCLALFAKMSATRFFSMQRIQAHELGKLEEIRNPPRFLERLVELPVTSRNVDSSPELISQHRDSSERCLQSFFIARHPTIIPHNFP